MHHPDPPVSYRATSTVSAARDRAGRCCPRPGMTGSGSHTSGCGRATGQHDNGAAGGAYRRAGRGCRNEGKCRFDRSDHDGDGVGPSGVHDGPNGGWFGPSGGRHDASAYVRLSRPSAWQASRPRPLLRGRSSQQRRYRHRQRRVPAQELRSLQGWIQVFASYFSRFACAHRGLWHAQERQMSHFQPERTMNRNYRDGLIAESHRYGIAPIQCFSIYISITHVTCGTSMK